MATLSMIAAKCGRGGENELFANRSFRVGSGRTFSVVAMIKKGKKHEYPWPNDMDPNSDNPLKYLSYFKPLDQKPKPVTLAFEKPLVDFEEKILEVSRLAEETGLDFSFQISALEAKYEQALKDLYTHLTPIQRLNIARHPNRPTVLDHIGNITEKWVELHGDRAGYDDPSMVTVLGSIEGNTYLFIGHQKGRSTEENIMRNFAMPTPHGYRKALRMMKYADHHGFPIITFVDTPGAFADLKSEQLGQGESIAQNLRTMFGLRVPIVTVVAGEGGSGGALAIACANKLLMMENSAFYVASPEACAAILWKSSKAAPKAAEKLRITAQEHYRLGIADGIIPEPLGGAHADPLWASQQIKLAILKTMEELKKMDSEELIRHRMCKFRSIGEGGYKEDTPVEPEKKRKMKPSEVNLPNSLEIESQLDDLRIKILEAKGPFEFDPATSEAIKKLEQELDEEMTKAFISMKLQEKVESLKLELTRAPPNKPLSTPLQEKADRIVQEFKRNMSRSGAYLRLKQKLQALSTVKRMIKLKEKSERLKSELNRKIPPDHSKLGEELENVLKSANLEIVAISRRENGNVKEKVKDLSQGIKMEIERTVDRVGIRKKIQELREEIARNSRSEKAKKLEKEIKEEIASALDVTPLREKAENLEKELASLYTTRGTAGDEVGSDTGR